MCRFPHFCSNILLVGLKSQFERRERGRRERERVGEE